MSINKSLMQSAIGWETSTGCQGVCVKYCMIHYKYEMTTLCQLMLNTVSNKMHVCFMFAQMCCNVNNV